MGFAAERTARAGGPSANDGARRDGGSVEAIGRCSSGRGYNRSAAAAHAGA